MWYVYKNRDKKTKRKRCSQYADKTLVLSHGVVISDLLRINLFHFHILYTKLTAWTWGRRPGAEFPEYLYYSMYRARKKMKPMSDSEWKFMFPPPPPASLSSAGYKPVCVTSCSPSASSPRCAPTASGCTMTAVRRGNRGVLLGLLAADVKKNKCITLSRPPVKINVQMVKFVAPLFALPA